MNPSSYLFSLMGERLMMFSLNGNWIDPLQVEFAYMLDVDSLGFNVKVLPLLFFNLFLIPWGITFFPF